MAGNQIKTYLDGTVVASATDSTYASGIRIGLRSEGSDEWDWIYARKYASAEPTIVSSGISSETSLMPVTSGGGNWYSSGGTWGYRQKVTINHNLVPNTDQTDFPVLIQTKDAGSPVFAKALASGNDILFTDSDGVTKRSHEIEKFDTTNKELDAWVKVPTLSHTTDTVLYMYFGNSGASDQQNKTDVWSNGYSGVWHLSDAAGPAKDSTTNNINASVVGTVTFGAFAKIGTGVSFNGSNGNYLDAGNSNNVNAPVSLSGWYNTSDAKNQGIIGKWSNIADGDSRQSYSLSTNGLKINDAFNATNGSDNGQTSTNTPGSGSWHYVVVTAANAASGQKIYIDGALDSQVTPSGTLLATTTDPLYLGAFALGWSAACVFHGTLNELRIQTAARSADWVATEYNNQNDPTLFATLQSQIAEPTVINSLAQNYMSLSGITQTLGSGSTGTIKYQISADNGSTWYWWNGSAWATTTAGYTESSDAATINTHLADNSFSSFGPSPKQFKFKAFFNSDGTQQPKLDTIGLTYLLDSAAPDNPTLATSKSQKTGGSDISSGDWHGYAAPYFTWNTPNDNANQGEQATGVNGYYIYFGTTATGDPGTTRGIATELGGTGVHYQTGTTFEIGVDTAALTSGQTYYLRIETKDNSNNTHHIAGSDHSLFTYKFENDAPAPPAFVTATPSSYTRTNQFTFSWPTVGAQAAQDTGGSLLAGNQYKVNNGSWSATTTDDHINLTDAATTGLNIFYLRAIDNAGNISVAPVQTNFYFNSSAPTAPTNLSVNPSTPSDANAFSFTWHQPLTYNGSVSGYYYSINVLPTITNTTFVTATSLPQGPYATQQGQNTLYLVAKDEAGNYDFDSCSNITGNPNIDGCAKVNFTANTSAPGFPTAVTSVDGSNRDLQQYKVFLTWNDPTNKGAGFDGYAVYRSTDGNSFSQIGTTSGTTYADTGLSSIPYSYYIKSKDNANQYSTASTTVVITPTGRYTHAPALSDGPAETHKAFSADITWETDRESSTIVKFSKNKDNLDQEASHATELTKKHDIDIKGLDPETQYFYQAVWIDSDGNQGKSDVMSLTTGLRPKISDVKVMEINLRSAIVAWTSTTISTSTINYGKTVAYGGTISDQSGSQTTTHAVSLANLEPGTDYHLQISGTDTDGNVLTSDDYSFSTLPLPLISNFTIQAVKDAASTTVKLDWTTNVETTTGADFSPKADGVTVSADDKFSTTHELTIAGLLDQTTYLINAKGTDHLGNIATSDQSSFTTPVDTRPPKITDLSIEAKSMSDLGAASKYQIIVSWRTDEPATSQVAYGEGTSSDSYASSTDEDKTISNAHVVVISNLDASKTYHVKAISKDRSGNIGQSDDNAVITDKAKSSALDLIIQAFQRAFSWLKIFNGN
jgi:hypothetical protein